VATVLEGTPTAHVAPGEGSRLNITVVFTSIESTLAALRRAGMLAEKLDGRITMLVPQIVPFPRELHDPPVMRDWNEHKFRVIAEAAAVDTSVQLCLCRDRAEALKFVLPARSLVFVGGRSRRFFPTSEERLAASLGRAGHEVIFIPTE
jgi:hypothetical protein